MKCQFCKNVEYDKKRSLTIHEKHCHGNPNRVARANPSNQFLKAEKLGIEKPQYSEEAKKKSRDKQSGLNSWWNTKENAEEIKQKHSDIMKQVVLDNLESYSSSNRGRVKCIEYDGIKFHGNWEVDFYKWCKQNNIKAERVTKPFEYELGNKKHLYFPDFYLEEKDLYVEIKGYETDKDRAKWNQFPNSLLVLKAKEIKQIRNNSFCFEQFYS